VQEKAVESSEPVGAVMPSPEEAVEHKELILDNRLRVIALRDPTPGLVAVQTWISVGSGGENTPGSTGYAHFFEHLMFHGTPTLTGEAREARLVALGVEENAWTSLDETCYHLLGPVQHLDELLRIEADRFAHLSLTAEGVRREAGAVYGELRKSEADPFNALWGKLWQTAFDTHPYSHDTLGLKEDIEAMPDGLSRALAFRAEHYRPDQALVVISGDIDPERVLDKVSTAFGGWTVDGPSPSEIPDEPAQRKRRRAHIDWTGPAVNPKLAVGWRVPAFTAGDPTSAALDVVRELLMSRASRLVRALIDENKLAFQVHSDSPDRVDSGLLAMMLDLQPGADAAAVLSAIDTALLDLSTVSEERVLVARGRVQRQRSIALSGPEGRGMAIGRMALHWGGAGAYSIHTEAVGQVDAAAIRRVLTQILTQNNSTVVSLSSEESK
jgi:zinc protease